jgi:hypothetical protein
MRFSGKAALLAVVLSLSGCATGYGKAGLTGGYTEVDGPGRLIEVNFYGNGFIRPDRVEIYLLYRAAEVTKLRGKRYMTVYQTIDAAIADRAISGPSAESVGGKPFGKVYLLLRDEQVAGALDADEVMARYAGIVKSPSASGGAKKGEPR